MSLTLGEKLRELREIAGMNQTQLGNAVNMTQRKVSYMERNIYEPSLEDIAAICNFFKISSDYLIGIPKGYSYPER